MKERFENKFTYGFGFDKDEVFENKIQENFNNIANKITEENKDIELEDLKKKLEDNLDKDEEIKKLIEKESYKNFLGNKTNDFLNQQKDYLDKKKGKRRTRKKGKGIKRVRRN